MIKSKFKTKWQKQQQNTLQILIKSFIIIKKNNNMGGQNLN